MEEYNRTCTIQHIQHTYLAKLVSRFAWEMVCCCCWRTNLRMHETRCFCLLVYVQGNHFDHFDYWPYRYSRFLRDLNDNRSDNIEHGTMSKDQNPNLSLKPYEPNLHVDIRNISFPLLYAQMIA